MVASEIVEDVNTPLKDDDKKQIESKFNKKFKNVKPKRRKRKRGELKWA